jgi:hypothetical protein
MKLTLTLCTVFLNLCFCLAQDQGQITIVGHIVNIDKSPLINATVLDLNTHKGTTTNKLGDFSLSLPKQTTSIRVSYRL